MGGINRGVKNGKSRLDENQVKAIRKRYWVDGVSSTLLAKAYGVGDMTILDACNYLTWKHVEDTFKYYEITRYVQD